MDKKIMGTHTGNPTIHDLNITYRVSRNKLLPVKAIEAYCVEFCKDSPRDVRLCHSETCPLHPYRLGQLPVDGDNPRKNLKDIEQPDSGINGIPVDELIMIF